MRVDNIAIFTNGDMSGNLTSIPFQMNQIYGWAAQFEFTGAPNGTMKAQVSCDPSVFPNQTPLPTNWTDLANSSIAITTSGDLTYNVNLSFYNWVRFIYTFTSGTGTVNGRLNSKGV